MPRGRGGLALAVVAAVLLLLVGRAVRNHVTEMDQAADEARLTTSELLVQAEQAREQGLDPGSLEDAYRDLVDTLPTDPDLSALIESLVELERSTGATLTIISLGEPSPVMDANDRVLERQQQIGMSLEVRGAEPLVRSFIGRLRNPQRLIVVDEVDIAWNPGVADQQRDSVGAPAVTALLQARAFMWSPRFIAEAGGSEVLVQ